MVHFKAGVSFRMPGITLKVQVSGNREIPMAEKTVCVVQSIPSTTRGLFMLPMDVSGSPQILEASQSALKLSFNRREEEATFTSLR